METRIRKAKKSDMPSVLSLIQELATFEKEPNAVEVTVAELEAAGFGGNPLFQCFVAEWDGEIVGMALFYFRFSTWKGKTVHLEDLVVSEAHRGKGIGTALYRSFLEFSQNENVRRSEWIVLNWNQNAIEMYDKSGACFHKDWWLVEMDREAMKRFLEAQSQK